MLKTSSTTVAITALMFVVVSHTTFAQGRELTPDRVNQKVQQAAVEIIVNGRLAGSGAIIDRSGVVLTAAHVANGKDLKIQVLLEDKQRVLATVHAKDASHDILLLKIPERSGGYPAISLAKKQPLVGSTAYLVGSPIFRHRLFFTGTVSQTHASAEFLKPHYVEVFYIQSASPHGTSGGAWVNRQGQLIGLQSAMLFVNNAPHGIAFVAPLPAIRSLLEKPRTVAVAAAGFAVEELWEQPFDYLQKVTEGTEGVVVKFIVPDSPLAKAQVPLGAILTSIDEQPILTRDAYIQAIRKHAPGDEVILKLRAPNNDTEQTFKFKLGTLQ